ncbi:MAG: hypothetical protein ACI965_002413, partial [Paraglaciecola sp.]
WVENNKKPLYLVSGHSHPYKKIKSNNVEKRGQ